MHDLPTASSLTLLLRPTEAASSLSISPRKLWALTQPRGPIPSIRCGRAVRYSPTDLQTWIDEQKEKGRDR